jgi:hypothetical protein
LEIKNKVITFAARKKVKRQIGEVEGKKRESSKTV